MQLTIRDLERESGLSRRTIHFYAQEGLLPAPDGAGPSSTYGEEHLLRLRLIPTLKSAGLRLDRIGCALDGLSLVEMRRLVQLAPDADLDDPVLFAEWLQRGRRTGRSPIVPDRGLHGADGNGAVREIDHDGDGARWVRRRLAPGVELHYCPAVADDVEDKVRRLSELARQLFAGATR